MKKVLVFCSLFTCILVLGVAPVKAVDFSTGEIMQYWEANYEAHSTIAYSYGIYGYQPSNIEVILHGGGVGSADAQSYTDTARYQWTFFL